MASCLKLSEFQIEVDHKNVTSASLNCSFFLSQSTPLGSTVYRNIQALDKDAGVNGLVEYFIVKGDTNTTEDEKLTSADGYGTFAISFPHQGQVSKGIIH